MFGLFVPRTVQRLVIYPAPISMRWGPDRLRAACERDLGLVLDRATGVLFHNRKQDTLVLYTLDDSGDRCVTKKLEAGTFLLPVPAAGETYAVVPASKLETLFRS
ncbi:MAG: IS66 family insertion sequence element accessory protein TnpB [Polyangiaceae bacterium]